MRVLITGSSGFIGSNLRKHLLSRDHSVGGLDWRYELMEYTNPKLDITKPGVFQRALGSKLPDVVVHLAAQVGRLKGEDDLIHTINSNAVMTTLVARACSQQGVKLIYASTSEVYGDNGPKTVDEWEGPFLTPHNLYGLSKRWGEEVIEMYYANERNAGKDVPDPVYLRLSMPYGPGVPPGRGRAALPNFLWQARNNMEIPVHKNAERSWCWIGDTINAIRMIIEEPLSYGPYNVGRDDDPRTMLSLALMACEMTKADPALIELVDPPGPQTLVKRLSTKRLQEDFHWKPLVEIQEGMTKTLEWVQRFDKNGKRVR